MMGARHMQMNWCNHDHVAYVEKAIKKNRRENAQSINRQKHLHLYRLEHELISTTLGHNIAKVS